MKKPKPVLRQNGADVAEKRADEEARARQQLESELRRLRGDTNNE